MTNQPTGDEIRAASAAAAAAAAYVATHDKASDPSTRKSYATASLILGIGGVLLVWTVVIGIPLLWLALICGIVSRRRQEGARGFAITGIILGTLSIIFTIIIGIFAINLAIVSDGPGGVFY